MFELARSKVDFARSRRDFVAVRQKVLIVLWTFLQTPEARLRITPPVPDPAHQLATATQGYAVSSL